jgi:hypothetical protein
MPVRLLPIRPGRLIGTSLRGGPKIRRIEVVLPGDPDQGEQGIPPGISARSSGPGNNPQAPGKGRRRIEPRPPLPIAQ